MKISCVIIDDEPLAIKVIENHLKKFENITIKGIFNNPMAALPVLKEDKVDVVFLDINMPEISGIEFLKSMPIESQVIMTTAYEEYAVESYNLEVLDYLVKPISFSRFLKSMNKLINRFQLIQNENTSLNIEPYLFLKIGKKIVRIEHDSVLYLESLKDYVKIHTKTGVKIAHQSLISITEELPRDKFLRIHRSYTVCLGQIESLEGNFVEINSIKIPIGRKYKATLKDYFKQKRSIK